MVLFLENVFRLNYEVFWQKDGRLRTLEKLETMMKSVFSRKTFSIFKPSLQKWDGAKYAGGSAPSC